MKDFAPRQKQFDPDVPVYDAKFKEVIDKLRLMLKGYQHSIDIVQKEDNGVTTETRVIITLRK